MARIVTGSGDVDEAVAGTVAETEMAYPQSWSPHRTRLLIARWRPSDGLEKCRAKIEFQLTQFLPGAM
jgi:hypothetical protein